jgi:hypothetical protein
MSGEQRVFRFKLSDGTTLEKTGSLEVMTHDGDLSRYRIVMSDLPKGLDPARIATVTLLGESRSKAAELVAEQFAAQERTDGNSLVLTALFRGRLQMEPPRSVRVVRAVLVVKASLTLLGLALLVAFVILPPPDPDGLLYQYRLGFLETLGSTRYPGAHLIANVLGKVFLPLLGCAIGVKAINQRRKRLLTLALFLLFLGSFSPLLGALNSLVVTLGILLVVAFNRDFKAYMANTHLRSFSFDSPRV